MDRVVQLAGVRDIDIAGAPTDEVAPGLVRVRTLYSGISAGTELTAYRGSNPYLAKRWDRDRRLFLDDEQTLVYPVSGFGYEEVGVVAEIGAGVTAVDVGDVVWGVWGHRSGAVLPEQSLVGHVLPTGVDPLAGVFARVGGIALNAVLSANVHLGEWVAIFGQGVLGLLATRLAVLNGARVIAVDRLPSRLELARSMGATAVVDASTESAAEEVRELTGGRGADSCIEISGSYRALHEAIRTATCGGRVVAAGFYQGEGLGLALGEEFHHNRIELVSSQISGVPPALAHRWDVRRLETTFVDLIASGLVDPKPLVTHVIPLEGAPSAYELLDEHPDEALQVVLRVADGELR